MWTRCYQSQTLDSRSGEVWGQPLLLVDGSLYAWRARRRGADTDAATGEGAELRRGADQNVHCLHGRDDPEVHHQHRPLQVLVHHNVSCKRPRRQ